ncbi:thermonuclease family protein [Simiduia sp. 21SJ11W-1]|uniref:thermonuclease family protein n=1 Tax=Simiduia sp. 21SJ11W-1 TaxID=2909669 RepID=UPI00209D9AB9|nr:thermonuclease family protein [Simiduia sp. 21SJ11W-1]UTA47531.1 thermonuclease family protein [Simiduia sp. 21SJ11W-1]
MRTFVVVFSILIFLFFTNSSHATQRQYGHTTISEVVSIYDGDTFTVNIDHWPAIVGQRISVRISGIDTPEMRSRCASEKERARAAKQFTVAALRKAQAVELHNVRRDKYFRLVADVWVDGFSLGQQLLDAGLAVPYSGKTKVDWCAQTH